MPLIAVVIGEGGSGGAVAIATANRILMLEHAIYTVASPEAAASILWRDCAKAIDAATNMKITAQDLDQLGVIDVIITEPVGGAHRDRESIMKATGDAIARALVGVRRQDRRPRSASQRHDQLYGDRPVPLGAWPPRACARESDPPIPVQSSRVPSTRNPRGSCQVSVAAKISVTLTQILRFTDRW